MAVVAAIHGIGFSQPGALEPFLKKIASGGGDCFVDANWNDVATKDYGDEITLNKVAQLAAALAEISEIRPMSRISGRLDRATEWSIDLIDIYLTAIFWLLPPILATLLLALVQDLHFPLLPGVLLKFATIYSIGFIVILGVSGLALLLLVLTGAPALAIARVNHILVAGLRPGLIMAFAYLAITRWKGALGWYGSLTLLALLALLGFGLLQYLDIAGDVRWILGTGMFVVYIVAPLLAARLIMPALKLTFDVLLYVTDPEYRAAIITSVTSKINDKQKEIESDGRLILIGHSLGSVIAADIVNSGRLFGKFDTVLLVTAGSPIRRMFQRLLPGHLLPPHSEEILKAGMQQFRFRWINFYRRFDGVGAKLGLPAAYGCAERASRLIRDPLTSHVGYWDEPDFVSFIRCAAEGMDSDG
jgi:hypothetical protein